MKKVKMQLFGSFELEYEGRKVTEETLHSKKLTKLLVYILMNRDTVLTHQQLLEVLGNDESQKPENVLKNLMYRMRRAMTELGEEKFINTSTGAYRWNPEISVESDYEQYEEQAEALQKEYDDAKRKALCYTILSGYKNNVTSKVAQETWMLPKTTWYQTTYMETAHTLCELLEKENDWQEMELICNKAMAVDSFDEDIHCWLLKSMHGQRKYDLAIAQYEKSKKTFYENMGIQPPESLQEAFQEMLGDIGEDIKDVSRLLEEMQETERLNGAFICDYHIFRQIYRIEVRRIERSGMAEHMLLLTIRKRSTRHSDKLSEKANNEGMEALELAIRCCLRAGDVASRYSPTQFVVLLPMCSYESGTMVAERIQKYFRKLIGKKGIELVWELSELTGDA